MTLKAQIKKHPGDLFPYTINVFLDDHRAALIYATDVQVTEIPNTEHPKYIHFNDDSGCLFVDEVEIL